MSKKISVKEFMDKYNAFANEELKHNYAISVIKNNYVLYEKKIAICEKIVESSYYTKTKNTDGVEIRRMHIDSPVNYMLYCLNIINNYTSIEIDFSNALEEFNLLNGSECLDLIFANISERELKEFRIILEMVEDDVMHNEYETHAFISNQVERFADVFKVVAKSAEPALIEISKKIESMDEKDINKFSDKIMKLIK